MNNISKKRMAYKLQINDDIIYEDKIYKIKEISKNKSYGKKIADL